ncbi:Immunity protein 7 [Ruminococcus albus]|uniref:Immunity protein 7 n=2 Tax=Ruminococcus albus TaxID=1264 RepID=A0A1H7F5G9_RUMAL|nr:Immunity protein 7 [Ruminococcus albus]
MYKKGTDMLELHGWLTIHECYGNEDAMSDCELNAVHDNIKKILNSHDCGITHRYVNGGSFLNVLHCSNHRTPEADEIIGVFTEISKAADGSYGVIYLRDDEDKNFCNEFQVFVFKHGKCSKVRDDNLSPCIPKIESDINNTEKYKHIKEVTV